MQRVADRSGPATGDRASAAWAGTGWAWVLGSGALLIAAGIAALLAPVVTTITVSIFVGWLLLVVGVAGIAMGLRTKRHHGRWGDLLYGVASFVVGGYILFDPLAGAMSLTLVLAIWFAIRGAIEVGGAVRVGPGRARGVLAVIGLIDLGLAGLLIANYPFPAVRAVGLFLGISFLMAGIATMATGLQLRWIAGA